MLSISNPIRAGNGEYYLSLASIDDYYVTSDLEPAGFWFGSGASALGLTGQVQPAAFRNVLRGFSADGSQTLVKNALGSAARRAGWDATWSVPKSVSTAWSQATPEMRAAIELAGRRAVERAIQHAETLDIVSRSGAKGIHRHKAKLIFAVFPHSLSRASDPQLHFHSVLMNIGVREDGTTGTLEPKALFRNKMLLGALFRVELAFQLEKSLGLRASIEGRSFELLGVPCELMSEFSNRRKEILEELARIGQSGAKAAAIAALNTRQNKEPIPREELFARWRELGLKHHWSTKDLSFLIGGSFPARNIAAESANLAQQSLRTITNESIHFSLNALLVTVLQQAQGRGLSATDALAVGAELLASPELVSIGLFDGKERFTTREIIKLEKEVIRLGRAMASAQSAEEQLPCVLAPAATESLSDEQQTALSSMLSPKPGGLTLLRGIAGAGKTTVFKAAREAWEKSGYTVFGAALSGKAAQELQNASGIQCQTLHSLIWELENGARHFVPKTVLVVDEAAMVGTRQLLTTLQLCASSGASCVLAGDDRQLQAIEHGGGFSALLRYIPSFQLNQIYRQQDEWARTAVRQLADGLAGPAMAAYAMRGLVQEAGTETEALARTIYQWEKGGGCENPKSHVILATTNAVVEDLNSLAQQQRLAAAKLSKEFTEIEGKRFYVGDRILCRQNNRRVGVWNGDSGTIAAVNGPSISIALDGRPTGQTIAVNTGLYSDIVHGYVLTAHRAQGTTLDNSLVLASRQNRELAYVEASRARHSTRWFTADSIQSVTESMEVSRKKEFVTELVPTLELTLS